MSATVRQATRSSIATTDRVAWQTSHAAVSSNAVVNRGAGPRPRHRGDHHPVLPARHPRRGGLQVDLGGAQVQAPPAPRRRAGVIARAAPPAARAAPRRPGLDPHPGHQQLLASLVGLQLHRLDHRVLDPEHPPPYPRRAHVVPVFVSGCGRPETEDRAACARHSTIFTGGHPRNRGSGALRTRRAGPRPARKPCPKGPQRLAGPGGRAAPSRSDAARRP